MSEICRICFENDIPENMISPCNCSGSQKYVHKDCIYMWLQTVMRNMLQNRVSSSQLLNCLVCKSPINLTIQPIYQNQSSRLLCLIKYILFKFWFVYFALIILAAIFFMNRENADLTRHVKSFDGLDSGILIEATPEISSGVYHQSIILITKYSTRDYTFGFIINKLIHHDKNIGAGGHVKVEKVFTLHNNPMIEGSQKVTDQIFIGGRVEELTEFDKKLQVHGYAVWGPLRLDEELRAGSWKIQGPAGNIFN